MNLTEHQCGFRAHRTIRRVQIGGGAVVWAAMALVLSFTLPARAQDVEPKDRQAVLSSARQRSVEQLLASSRSEDPFRRANAMEAARHLPQRGLPMVQLGLEDDHPAVRFAALVTVGDLRLKSVSASAKRLLKDESASVRAAAMFAMRRIGEPVDITPLAAMLVSQDPSLRGNVAMLLGRLGERSAAPMLLESAKAPMPRVAAVRGAIVRLQIAEAVLRLGDDSALDALRAAAYSPFDEVRVLAVQIMGRLRDERMILALKDLLQKPPIEVQLAAAESLARLGQFDGKQTALAGCASEIANVRSQAALTAVLFPGTDAARTVVALLEDPAEQVRLAAAAAVLQALRARAPGGGEAR